MAAVLDAADAAPVVIERRGKPRAVVVSARRFDLYETVLRALTDEMASEVLEAARGAARAGRAGEAAALNAEAAALRRAAPGLAVGGKSGK